jgi:hypothetical protein
MKYFFVIAKYSDYRQEIFDTLISPRNAEYCNIHGYKYVVIDNHTPFSLKRNNPIWWKLYTIKGLLDADKLNIGDEIVAFDADCIICDNTISLTPITSMSYAIDSGNTHCMGWYSFIINDWSKQFINKLLDDDIFNRNINNNTYHTRLRTYSSMWAIWAEQAAFYNLAGVQRHSDISFWDMPNFGWHSEPTNDSLSLTDLTKNINILPTEYNVSIWPEESDLQFYINKIDDKDMVKIRHITGSDWRVAQNWIK